MPIARSFFFLRHGETDWNKELRLQGWSDRPLNDTGIRQAEDVIPVLQKQPIDLVVASPLVRALKTAEIVNEALQKEMIICPDMRERNFGDLEGLTLEDVRDFREKERIPEYIEENGYPAPPGGETYPDFKYRVFTTFNRHLSNHPGKNILFVAHGGIYRALRFSMVQDHRASGNVEPWFFDKTPNDGKNWVLRRLT